MATLTEKALAKALRESIETGRDVVLNDSSGSHGSGSMRFRARAGRGAFYYRYMHDGKRATLPIGPYDPKGEAGVTLAQARDKFLEHARTHRDGTSDVRGALKAEQEERKRAAEAAERARIEHAEETKHKSLRALLDGYVKHLERQGKSSWRDTRNIIRLNVYDAHPTIAAKHAAEVSPEELAKILSKMVERGAGRTAGKLRSYLHAAYRIAIAAKTDPTIPSDMLGFRIGVNPASGVATLSKFNRTRERVLSESELGAYVVALAALPDSVYKDALHLGLYLGGQRMAQLVRAKIADVDLDERTITLFDPKGRREQPRVHVLPLIERSLAIVNRRIEIAQERESSLLFSTHGRVVISAADVGRVVSEEISPALVKADRVREPFQLRDVRRTGETLFAKLKVSKEVRAHVQSHGISGVQDRHYNKYEFLSEKTKVLKQWDRFLRHLATGESAKVIPIARKKAA